MLKSLAKIVKFFWGASPPRPPLNFLRKYEGRASPTGGLLYLIHDLVSKYKMKLTNHVREKIQFETARNVLCAKLFEILNLCAKIFDKLQSVGGRNI